MVQWRVNAPRLSNDFDWNSSWRGVSQCGLPSHEEIFSKAFDTRGAFAKTCTFPVHLVTGERSGFTHCMQSFPLCVGK